MRRRAKLGGEDALQVSIAEYLHRCWPSLIWWHTPNGGARSPREGARFRRMGVRAGVPDLVIIGREGRAIFVELKTDKGRLSDAQGDFLGAAREAGCLCFLARSLSEMMAIMLQLRDDGIV